MQQISGVELTLTDHELTQSLERIDVSGRPLYAYLLAQQLSISTEGYDSWTEIDLLKFQLERDKFRWEKAFKENETPTWGDNHPAMKLAVLATIARNINFEDELIEKYFGVFDSSIRKEAISITTSDVINSSKRPKVIEALQPDLLGEWFVLYCFSEGLKVEELLDIAWEYSPDNTAMFLQHITQDFIDIPKEYNKEGLIEKLLAYKPSHESHYQALADVATVIIVKLHQSNLSIPQNLIAALEHAAKLCDGDAMNSLGFLYSNGISVARNPEKAFGFYRQAADQGSSEAMVNLGVYYQIGEVVERNHEEAINLYLRAIDKGYSGAMHRLGICFQEGEGVEQNLSWAFELYQQAVEHGSSDAMLCLGFFYEKG